jgi:CPA2 family monovalent cation:H+ antiporter-2
MGRPSAQPSLEQMRLEDARVLVITMNDPFETRLVVERARQVNPYLEIISQAILSTEASKLRASGASEAVVAEDEAALELARHGLRRFGVSSREALAVVQQYRARVRDTV